MENTAPDLQQVRAEAAEAERSRIAGITALCSQHGMDELGRQLIDGQRSLDEARAAVLDKLGSKPVEAVKPIDLSEAERSENVGYMIGEGIKAAMRGKWDTKEAGFVREMSREVELKGGVERTSERSFFVPFGALATRATYVTSGATTGGNLVAEDLLAARFIESLRNEESVMNLGITEISGLVGDVKIPRRTANSTGYWLSTETTAITQSESTFDQISMVPRQLAALSKFSRQTLQQATPGIENLIRGDLSRTIRLAMDLAVLNGSGASGQPTGILQTSGIGSVAMGTNGAALDMESVVDLETELAQDNALSGRLNYLTSPKVVASLKKLRAGGSTTTDGAFLYNTDLQAIGRGATPGTLNGYPISSSNQVPQNGTKGTGTNLHTMLFGDFSACLVGFWGAGVEITLGEDSDDFSKLLQSVRAVTTMDVAVQHPEAFAAITDIVVS